VEEVWSFTLSGAARAKGGSRPGRATNFAGFGFVRGSSGQIGQCDGTRGGQELVGAPFLQNGAPQLSSGQCAPQSRRQPASQRASSRSTGETNLPVPPKISTRAIDKPTDLNFGGCDQRLLQNDGLLIDNNEDRFQGKACQLY
jgi:hypothetical protein